MYGINIVILKAQCGTTRQNMMPSSAAAISIFSAFRARVNTKQILQLIAEEDPIIVFSLL